MTAVPGPPYPPSATTPVLALKELVATLHREQHKVQDMLSSLGFALRSFNNLNQFLELTPFMATRMTGADGSALILFKPEGQIALEQIYGRERRLTQNIRQAMNSVIQSLNVADPLTFAQGSRNLEEKIRLALGPLVRLYSTPVLVNNEELGRIYIFSEDRHYIWNHTRRKLLQLIADQTSVAIANSELTLELRSRERQDKELEIASEIQNQLLPRRCPHIRGLDIAARCQTANLVGGDYYDFIPTNYDQLKMADWEEDAEQDVPWSIVIGDVMGKGLPAGLIMTMTRGMLRAEVLNRHSPAQVLRHLNRVMFADLDNSHRFVTLFYSEYDPATSVLSFSNAAHNPPLLWRSAQQEILTLDTEGALIGLEADSEYREDHIILYPQDVVLYYTDGLTEAVNGRRERFDEDNLRRVCQEACQQCPTPQKMLDYIFEQVQSFTGSRNNHQDDMTLVIMQVKSTE